METSAGLNQKAKDKFKAGIEAQLQKLQRKDATKESRETAEERVEQEERKEKRNGTVTEVANAHPQYPGLDQRLEVCHTAGQGRFVRAHQLVPAGTVLMAEEPLGWALEVERMGTHCQHCLGQVHATSSRSLDQSESGVSDSALPFMHQRGLLQQELHGSRPPALPRQRVRADAPSRRLRSQQLFSDGRQSRGATHSRGVGSLEVPAGGGAQHLLGNNLGGFCGGLQGRRLAHRAQPGPPL